MLFLLPIPLKFSGVNPFSLLFETRLNFSHSEQNSVRNDQKSKFTSKRNQHGHWLCSMSAQSDESTENFQVFGFLFVSKLLLHCLFRFRFFWNFQELTHFLCPFHRDKDWDNLSNTRWETAKNLRSPPPNKCRQHRRSHREQNGAAQNSLCVDRHFWRRFFAKIGFDPFYQSHPGVNSIKLTGLEWTKIWYQNHSNLIKIRETAHV